MASLLLLVSEFLRKDHDDGLGTTNTCVSTRAIRLVKRSTPVEFKLERRNGPCNAESEQEDNFSSIMAFNAKFDASLCG
ncbi:hypothetical protein SUGI_1095380 [Cryptomeria japonica]|nr:hypothetical protein SUGI_1095380 [Cryptomeria japonica]